MSSSNPFSCGNSPSAFPNLPVDADALPEIPGGWHRETLDVADRSLTLFRPGNPDLFLDDEQVHAENSRNDYMPYWAFLWPSAVTMATAVVKSPDWPAGSEVLELGAGTGLVGLAGLLRGDRVVFSDYDRTALHLCRLNARLNGLGDPELLHLDWREQTSRRFSVMIGCEVTYDATLHETLLDLLERMLLPGGICWLGDPGRYQSRFFFEKAQRRSFDLELTDGQGTVVSEITPGEFHLLKIRR
jgi:predicted nicotinamide N-methyase